MEREITAEFYDFVTLENISNKDLIKFLAPHAYKWWFMSTEKRFVGCMQIKYSIKKIDLPKYITTFQTADYLDENSDVKDFYTWGNQDPGITIWRDQEVNFPLYWGKLKGGPTPFQEKVLELSAGLPPVIDVVVDRDGLHNEEKNTIIKYLERDKKALCVPTIYGTRDDIQSFISSQQNYSSLYIFDLKSLELVSNEVFDLIEYLREGRMSDKKEKSKIMRMDPPNIIVFGVTPISTPTLKLRQKNYWTTHTFDDGRWSAPIVNK